MYSAKENFKVKDIQPEIPTLTNFSVTRNEIYQILIGLDVTKSRGPNGYSPVFYQKRAKKMSVILHIIMRNIKRLRKLPKNWKIAAIRRIFKIGNKILVENYRPVSLFNTDTKVFEKSITRVLFDHFVKFLTKHQHGLVRTRSVTTNMLSFLQKIYQALDRNSNDDITIFY